MVKKNVLLTKLPQNYLFQEIAEKAARLKKNSPDLTLLHLGIGDITKPICKPAIEALCSAGRELLSKNTLRGYGPSEGEPSLKRLIQQHEYGNKIAEDEIFISDGTKNDLSAIQELFSSDNVIALPDPAYPVYLESNILSGKITNNNFITLPCTEQTGFLPLPPTVHCDIIYLCSPCNPTGAAFTKKGLQKWIDYALKEHAIILYDGAYEAFISDCNNYPRSIYELDGADETAIEFRSFSKTAGFTGLRLSYVVIPKKLKSQDGFSFNEIWTRAAQSKFGGVSYPVQKAGEALYSPAGKTALQETLSYYKENASILKKGLLDKGFTVFGGDHSPYIWCKTPQEITSWAFFDQLLLKGIITTPGSGFGQHGEGFIRFSAFADRTAIEEALNRL